MAQKITEVIDWLVKGVAMGIGMGLATLAMGFMWTQAVNMDGAIDQAKQEIVLLIEQNQKEQELTTNFLAEAHERIDTLEMRMDSLEYFQTENSGGELIEEQLFESMEEPTPQWRQNISEQYQQIQQIKK